MATDYGTIGYDAGNQATRNLVAIPSVLPTIDDTAITQCLIFPPPYNYPPTTHQADDISRSPCVVRPDGHAPTVTHALIQMVIDQRVADWDPTTMPIGATGLSSLDITSPLLYKKIVGHIYDSLNAPLSREVIAIDARTGLQLGRTRSDAQGQFDLRVMTARPLLVIALPDELDGRNALVFDDILPVEIVS